MIMGKMYGIYDTQEDYQCVGMFDTVAEVANKLGLKPNHVSSIISKKKRYKHRYVIERIELEDSQEDD